MIVKSEVGHLITVLLSCRRLKLCTEIDERVFVATLSVCIMGYQAVLGDIRRYWGPEEAYGSRTVGTNYLTKKRAKHSGSSSIITHHSNVLLNV